MVSIPLLYVLVLTTIIAAEQFFLSQRFSSSMTAASGSGKMLPLAAPVSHEYCILNDPISSLSDMSVHTLLRPTDVPGGYTSNHQLYNENCGKMLLAASSTHVQTVTIRAAIHHLKPEGKSGTLLVGVCLSL
jgi:hypothetical protein